MQRWAGKRKMNILYSTMPVPISTLEIIVFIAPSFITPSSGLYSKTSLRQKPFPLHDDHDHIMIKYYDIMIIL